MKTVRYYNAKILRDHQIKHEDLWIFDGKIISPQNYKADQEIDSKGLLIAPGYIDLQINGAFGIDFSRQPEQVEEVAKKLVQYGVTSFLPTVVSSKRERYSEILSYLKPRKTEGATILGVHLEGPFLNYEKSGAHNSSFINSSFEPDYYGNLEHVKLVTLAPELPGAIPFIKFLREKNIQIAAGHTCTNFEQMEKSGIKMITHLFNAMTSLAAREPGLICFTLTQEIAFSIIADGIHVDPWNIQLAWKANPKGFFLVTDGMEAMGVGPGDYHIGDLKVTVSNDKACLEETEKLAGSILTMDQAVRNLQKFTRCSIVDALEAASLKPATLLGIEKQKGTLAFGADADLIFLDDNLQVNNVVIPS